MLLFLYQEMPATQTGFYTISLQERALILNDAGRAESTSPAAWAGHGDQSPVSQSRITELAG